MDEGGRQTEEARHHAHTHNTTERPAVPQPVRTDHRDNLLMNGGWWGVFLRIRDEVVSMEHHQRQAAQGTLGPRWARSNRTQDDQRPHALCIALLTDPEGHATTFLLEAWWPTHLKT